MSFNLKYSAFMHYAKDLRKKLLETRML